jgi:Dyp-type peroxidase family
MQESDLNFDEIQGFILSSYQRLPEAAYLFFHVSVKEAGREWLAEVRKSISFASNWDKKESRINVAFTSSSLLALGVDQRYCDTFSVEFQEGVVSTVNTPSRSYYLGDVGGSAPENWEIGGPNTPQVHVMLLLFAADKPTLDELKKKHIDLAKDKGLDLLKEEGTIRLTENKEHFGFRDSISQPFIKGNHGERKEGQDEIATGEFVLGYVNEYGIVASMPADPLGSNGSYLVYRKLEQDVKLFHDFLLAASGNDPEKAQWLGAKMFGRWQDGTAWGLRPQKDSKASSKEPNNEFKFYEDDPLGHKTPIGSHIRRANPRDGLETDPKESVKTVNRHRIVRRGRMYGSPYVENSPDKERGMLFIAINADIKRQFEFVQETWINDPKFNGLDTDEDPIVGVNGPNSTFTIQHWPIRQQITSIPRFVKVKAADYFFLPSNRALEFIASGA